jgi:hypothetical protein
LLSCSLNKDIISVYIHFYYIPFNNQKFQPCIPFQSAMCQNQLPLLACHAAYQASRNLQTAFGECCHKDLQDGQTAQAAAFEWTLSGILRQI